MSDISGIEPRAVAVPTTTTVPGGGTGQTTLTNHGVLIGQGANPIVSPPLGTAGQVLTSNGASSDPSFQAVPGVTSGIAIGTTTTLNQASGVWQDITGLSRYLDSAGSYIVDADVRGEISVTLGAGAFIVARLHDGTSPIADSETIVCQANVLSVLQQNTAHLSIDVQIAAPTTIKVQCARVFSGTILSSSATSDSNGKCRLRSVKRAP